MALMHEEYTEVLRRCFFEVQNEVGLGRQELAYHTACRLWFEEHRIPVASKLPHRLMLDNEVAHTLFPDFVGWDALAVEIKAVPRKLLVSEWVQIRDYMKCRNESLGLLVNFGLDRVHVERVAYTPQPTSLVEDWSYWQGQIAGEDRDLGKTVRDALHSIYAAHTTGYGTEVVENLLLVALQQRGLRVSTNPVAKAFFHKTIVDESPLECLVVNERLVLVFTALFDSNEFNISRGLSFIKSLGLNWGVAVNFGRTQAQFTGLRRTW